MPLTTRLDANLGYTCNNNCLFCYFTKRKKEPCDLSTYNAKGLFRNIRRLKIEILEITGGEVTLRDDFLSLVSFAKKELGFKKISVISNGSRFCDRGFTEKAIASGVDEILISLHAQEKKLHDFLSGRMGAFDDAINAIAEVQRCNAQCRTNTVITKLNYKEISHIADLLYRLGIRQVNFILFSPLDDAREIKDHLWPRYSESSIFIKEMIDMYKEKFTTISIKVIPFCFMVGYEQYVTDLFQNNYDPFEWNLLKRIHIRRGFIIKSLAAFTGMACCMDLWRIARIGWHRSLCEGIVRIQAQLECTKKHECRYCKFDLICPGIWKPYAKKFSLEELTPVLEEKISDIDHYMKQRFSDLYLSA